MYSFHFCLSVPIRAPLPYIWQSYDKNSVAFCLTTRYVCSILYRRALYLGQSSFCFTRQASSTSSTLSLSRSISYFLTFMLTTHRCVVSVVQIRLLCQQITACVEDVAKWMGANRLQLAKTEFLWCSSRQRLHQLPVSPVIIGGNSVHPASVVRDLGVWIDRGLSNVDTCYQGCRRVFCCTAST